MKQLKNCFIFLRKIEWVLLYEIGKIFLKIFDVTIDITTKL